MIELLRNCSHGSEIGSYLLTGNSTQSKKIVKVAYTHEGIVNLRHEIEGWSWYQQCCNLQDRPFSCEVLQERDSFLKITIEFIEGEKPNYGIGLLGNAAILVETIKHYCSTWMSNNAMLAPIHGDLSLDNVIRNSEGIHIIDWEHFHLNGGPLGFDAVYLLMESLWFSMRNRKEPSHTELNLICECLSLLKANNKLAADLFGSPLHLIRNFIRTNADLWGTQLRNFPDKFPVLLFSEDQVSQIDRMINKSVR